MSDINIIAVVVAALGSFIFGALWYSPLLFMRRWCIEAGISMDNGIDNPARVYSLTFALNLVSAAAMAVLLTVVEADNALWVGILLGLGVVATSTGINYQFAKNSLVHWLIDSGFHVGRFVVIVLLLSAF